MARKIQPLKVPREGRISSGEQEIVDLIKMDIRWNEVYQGVEKMIGSWNVGNEATTTFLTRKMIHYLHKKLKPIENG